MRGGDKSHKECAEMLTQSTGYQQGAPSVQLYWESAHDGLVVEWLKRDLDTLQYRESQDQKSPVSFSSLGSRSFFGLLSRNVATRMRQPLCKL